MFHQNVTLEAYLYLAYMVRMVSFMEAMGVRRLLSPLPLKTSFIPASYTLDTSSIAQLLMTSQRITKFRKFFLNNVEGGFPLPGLKNKATLLSSVATMSGRTKSSEDEALFKDGVWTYLAHFKNHRTRVLNPLLFEGEPSIVDGKLVAWKDGAPMRFDHCINTDGYSVTLVVSNRENRGKKTLFKSAVSQAPRKKKQKSSGEFPFIKPQTAVGIRQDVEQTPPTNLIGGDPGKTVLLQLVDRSGAGLRYTAAQRRHDTLSRLRTVKVLNARQRPTRDGELSAAKIERVMAKRNISPKTCVLAKLQQYVAFRELHSSVLMATYERKVFRAMRFLAWRRRSASVERFAMRILEKYGNGTQKPDNQVTYMRVMTDHKLAVVPCRESGIFLLLITLRSFEPSHHNFQLPCPLSTTLDLSTTSI